VSASRPSAAVLARRIALGLVGAWCFFWWGFAFGTHSAQQAELRMLSSRLSLWEAIEKEKAQGGEARPPVRLYDLDRERLSNLELMTDASVLYFVLAPVFTPYATYELHQMTSAYGGGAQSQ
jgi:hypothetical protein